MSSDILKMVHASAKALHQNGLLKLETMREFNVLCLQPVQELSPEDIQAIRVREQVSQPVFAKHLNASLSTIKKWETGEKKPRGVSLKLLNIILHKGLEGIA